MSLVVKLGHAYYLATDEDRDGRLDHRTVCAADGFGTDEGAALQGLRQRTVGAGEPLRLLLVGPGRPTDFTAPLRSSAACRVSETPFVATRHGKRRGRRQDPPALCVPGRSQDFARRVLVEELDRRHRRPDVPLPAAVKPPDGHRLSVRRLPPLAFRRFRRKASDDGGRRAAAAYRIVFASPVRGPICLGHSSHFGPGLFLPEPPPSVQE